MQLTEYIISSSLRATDDLAGTARITSSSNDALNQNVLFLKVNDSIYMMDKGGQIITGTYNKLSHDYKYIFVNDIQYVILQQILIGKLG